MNHYVLEVMITNTSCKYCKIISKHVNVYMGYAYLLGLARFFKNRHFIQ